MSISNQCLYRLSMLHRGARGETAKEIRQTLSLDVTSLKEENFDQYIPELLASIKSSSEQYILDISNAMLSQVRFPVRDEYKEVLKTHYNAVLKEVDFAINAQNAVDEINTWISHKTRGKIQKLLESLDPSTVLVLLNAVYFKSAWEYEFDPKETTNETFHNNGANPITVPMMYSREKVFYCEDESFSVLKLPYKGNKLSMVFVLPNERDGLPRVEQQINAVMFVEILNKMWNIFVSVQIPSFKLEYSKELSTILASLGMNTLFADEADLGGISEKGKLKVSKVVHKAYVEVNEEGSEAAGTSSEGFVLSSFSASKEYCFIADHPFLFFIRDEGTGMILFSGRLNEL